MVTIEVYPGKKHHIAPDNVVTFNICNCYAIYIHIYIYIYIYGKGLNPRKVIYHEK